MNKGIIEVLLAKKFLFNNPIELDAFQGGFIGFCVAISLLFLGIAYLRAQSINWDASPKPTDHVQRRIWFWGLLAATLLVLWLYSEFYIQRNYIPPVPPILLSKWDGIQQNGLLGALGAYLVVGLGTSFIGKGKWHTIIQKKVR
jgi:hypothetical protein